MTSLWPICAFVAAVALAGCAATPDGAVTNAGARAQLAARCDMMQPSTMPMKKMKGSKKMHGMKGCSMTPQTSPPSASETPADPHDHEKHEPQ